MADQVGGKDTINNYLKAMGKQPWEAKEIIILSCGRNPCEVPALLRPAGGFPG